MADRDRSFWTDRLCPLFWEPIISFLADSQPNLDTITKIRCFLAFQNAPILQNRPGRRRDINSKIKGPRKKWTEPIETCTIKHQRTASCTPPQATHTHDVRIADRG